METKGKTIKKEMKLLKALINSFRFPQFFFFLSVLTMGFFSVKNGPSYLSISKLILCAVSIFFLWWGNSLINDFYDLQIDKITNRLRPLVRGLANPEDFKKYGFLFLFVSLIPTFFVGLHIFLISVFCVILSILYSPLKWGKSPFASLFIALGSSLVFIQGSLIFGVTKKSLIFSLFLFLSLSLVVTSKDLKDYEAEKGKVLNVFTFFGREKGKVVNFFFNFFGSLIWALLVKELFWILLFVSLSISLFFFITEKLKIIMFLYLAEISFIFYFYFFL